MLFAYLQDLFIGLKLMWMQKNSIKIAHNSTKYVCAYVAYAELLLH